MIFLLPQIIDRAAERQPEHEAFRFGGVGLTYAALTRRANGLARILRDLGVCRGDRVGVLLDKSLESAQAIYGIMKAGAAYVPLDPAAPISRTASVIRDCRIRHLVTAEQKRRRLEALRDEGTTPCRLVGVDAIDGVETASWEDVGLAAVDSPPAVGTMEQDLAYIMYTSGSTGTPKGIMHTHHSGLSYAKLAATTYGVSSDDRLGNHSPLHFDMSTFDYFSGPLGCATTVIIPEAHTKLPASLSQLVQDEKLTIWYSVPFALIQLLLRGVLDRRDLGSLRWVLFGGEPFPTGHLKALMERLPGARFSNVYGPAEVNQCTYFHVPRPAELSEHGVPIGKVWSNADGLVLDAEDRPIEGDEIGELVVRTPTMMRGYWGRPDMNARAFHDLSREGGVTERFYRTGDLVQRLPDGNLVFHGRKDRQVKIRGYRVELDEVESALGGHGFVEEAAAYVIPTDDGSMELLAAAIPVAESRVTVDDLVGFLGGRLPHYAVPAGIRLLDRFPRTTSGKIDRRALRDQAVEESAAGRA